MGKDFHLKNKKIKWNENWNASNNRQLNHTFKMKERTTNEIGGSEVENIIGLFFSSSFLPPYFYTKFDRFLNQLGFTPPISLPPISSMEQGPVNDFTKGFFFFVFDLLWIVSQSVDITGRFSSVAVAKKTKTKSIFVDFKVENFNFIYDF